jgi:hypothetical protein
MGWFIHMNPSLMCEMYNVHKIFIHYIQVNNSGKNDSKFFYYTNVSMCVKSVRQTKMFRQMVT